MAEHTSTATGSSPAKEPEPFTGTVVRLVEGGRIVCIDRQCHARQVQSDDPYTELVEVSACDCGDGEIVAIPKLQAPVIEEYIQERVPKRRDPETGMMKSLPVSSPKTPKNH